MIANAFPCITSITSYPEYTNVNQAGLTPPQIATAYNIPASTGANVKIGIISLGGGWWPGDLQKSLSNIGVTLSQPITSIIVDNAANTFSTSDGLSGENTLDLYCVAGMAPGANIVIYTGVDTGNYYFSNAATAAGLNSTRGFANVLNRAVNDNCDIISISWAAREILSNVSATYCGDFLSAPLANAASKGITVLVASGDYGSIGSNVAANVTSANYPSTSSNVVSVGGTNLQLTAGNLRLTETVDFNDAGYPSGWGSGGGISNFITVPSWQTNLTYKRYFAANASTSAPITLTTRGVPDIAGPMNTYGLWFGNTITGFGGTSAATPIMAGMLARFMSLNGGRRPIPNAIHPILYGNLNAYYDITTGNNATVSYSNGYAASSNWDPVTGLGVPFGNVVYQMVSSGGTTVKTAANTWSYLANVRVKTAANTWSNVRSIYTKTVNGWQQTF